MVRFGASVGREPVFSTVVYTAVQRNVVRNAFRATSTTSQYIKLSSTKFALDQSFVTNLTVTH